MEDVYPKIKIALLGAKLMRNKRVSFLVFLFLVTAIIFIQMHPKSVWYYFIAGFFACRIIGLIFQQAEIQFFISESIQRLKDLYGK